MLLPKYCAPLPNGTGPRAGCPAPGNVRRYGFARECQPSILGDFHIFYAQRAGSPALKGANQTMANGKWQMEELDAPPHGAQIEPDAFSTLVLYRIRQ